MWLFLRIRSRFLWWYGAELLFVLIIIITWLFLRIRSWFLWWSGAELLFVLIIIISLLFLFLGSGDEFIIFEDPEPNYYFCINNNNFVIIFIFRIRSRIFRIRSRIFRIRRCIIILLIIKSLFFLRIRSRIIILLIIRIILLILKGPEWKKHKDYELIIIY